MAVVVKHKKMANTNMEEKLRPDYLAALYCPKPTGFVHTVFTRPKMRVGHFRTWFLIRTSI
jgi:hypothetical protein